MRDAMAAKKLITYNEITVKTQSTVGLLASHSYVHCNNVYCNSTIPERGTTAQDPLPYNLRHSFSTFRGRIDYLKDLTVTLNNPNYDVVVVYGLSGVGKSELCNQYAWQNIHRYQKNIVWLNAEHLPKELLELARELGVNTKYTDSPQPSDRSTTRIMKDIYFHLRKKDIGLLIIDDVLTRHKINDFLPGVENPNIRVLITSPYGYWIGPRVCKINLKPLSNDECKEILAAIVGSKLDLMKQKQGLDKLLNVVEGVPLALQICGAYISYECRASEINLKTYVDQLLENEKDLLENFYWKTSEREYTKTIYISFKTTLDKIETIFKDFELSDILEIVNVCAYLNAEAIPLSLLQEICQTHDLSRAILVLKDFSLIVGEQVEQVRMHTLIQKAIILHQKKSGKNSIWFQKVLVYFLTCNECCEIQLAEVLSHAKHCTEVILDLLENHLYTSKLLLLLNDYNTLKAIFAEVKDVEKIEKLVRGSNLLHMAVHYNKRQIVDILVTYEDDLDRLDDEGLSPLLIAAARGLEDVAELLISRGARMRMSGYSRPIVGKVRINPSSATWTTEDGNTLLHLAAFHGHVGLCEHSLAAPASGCNINSKNNLDWSPVHLAAQEGHEHVLRLLLKVRGVAVDMPGSTDRRTALMQAAQRGQTEAVRCLLKHGESVRKRDFYQWPALHHASDNGHAATAKLLAEAPDCKVNCLDDIGMSALHVAARKGHLDVVRELCAAGARGDVLDYTKFTPLDRASQRGYTKVCEFLKERFPEVKGRRK